MITIKYEGPDHLYIKLFYKIRNWRWFHDAPTRDMFIWLLLHANRTDEDWKGITIHRGQKVTSYEHMSEELGFSIKQLRRAEKNLKETGEVAVKLYAHFQVISILSFDKYQSEGRQKGNQRAGKGQAKGNNNKSIESEESEESIKPASAEKHSADTQPVEPHVGSAEWLKAHYDDDWEDEQ